MLNGTRQHVIVYHLVMAKRKPRANESQVDGGGGVYPAGFGLSARLSNAKTKIIKPIRNTSYKIGESVAPAPRAPTWPRSGEQIKTLKGSQVYTSEGVYPGSKVLVQKPALTPGQVEGIVQGQMTRAQNQYWRDVDIGARGAIIGGVAGAATTIGIQQGIKAIKEIPIPKKNKSRNR
jgi:hypothetical protein